MGIKPFEGSTMKKSGLPLVLFGLLLGSSLPVTSAHAQATRTWVSGVGDDVNPCSRTAPCKTFAGAISKTAAGGEIDCLDPGGFGNVTITKSMSIDCGTFPGGDLNAGAVNGVVVNTAAASDKVILRNLVIQGCNNCPSGSGLNGIRWINLGQELHLDRVVVTGDTTIGVDVNKTSAGTLYVRDSYITEVPTGISVISSVATVTAMVNRSYLLGMSGTCVVAKTNAFVTVANSVITSCNVALSAANSGAIVSANNNVISFSQTGVSAVAGSTIRMSNNDLYDNATGISNAGTFLSNGKNNVSGGNPGSTSNGTIPLR
jgi:hypothetical protein